MKKILFAVVLILCAVTANAQEQSPGGPSWSFEVKGGRFAPALPNWREFYGKRDMPEYNAALAYKLLRQVEIGIEGGYDKTTGHAFAPLHNMAAGDVTYELYPVNAFLLLRGIAGEGQWLVPYIGGGYSRIYYRETIAGQGTTRGSADGYHYRGGLQFLLDAVDPDSANGLYMDYGVYHTYLIVEAERTHAVVKSAGANIGGTSWHVGLLFEY